MTQGLENIYMHKNDRMVIKLDDLIAGQGGQIDISSELSHIIIEPEFQPVYNVGKIDQGCGSPMVTLDDQSKIFLKCEGYRFIEINNVTG